MNTPLTNKEINEVLAFFDRTSDQFFSRDEFRARLASGAKLRIKYGVDVTAPTLHIGHAVNLWLMRGLQDRGHKVVFLIGDFTTRIGDPDGKMDTRPVIARADIDRNAREFIEQAKMVLRFDDPELLEVVRNADWLDAMPLQNFMDLVSQVTHAKLISRDMFQKRITANREIHMHELLYPVLQGWDSVAVQSDLTIIGSDQLFNEMMGRFFQERNGQKPQTIITTKITPGTDGKGKQSKSVGNYVGLGHSPRDKFGRVMSIPDQLMEEWFVIYTDLPMTEIAELKRVIKKDPREAKLRLASAIVARYHGLETGRSERDWFENAFSKGNIPEDVPSLPIVDPRISVFDLVKLTRPGKSKGDTRRLIKQGGVELQGEKLSDPDEMLLVGANDILRVGKRNWFRIEIVKLNIIETDRLWMKPLEIQDIDLLVKYLPEWDIVKYLTRPTAAKLPPAKASGAVFEMMKPKVAAASTKAADTIAREVFKKVISQPEPKDEWLWKILPKTEPEKIIGVAHLRRDFEHGNQNVWLDPAHRGQGYTKEATSALNTHAFNNLNFSTIVFKDAFAHAARDLESLRAHFAGPQGQAAPVAMPPVAGALPPVAGAVPGALPPGAVPPAGVPPTGVAPATQTWHVTREAWQQTQAAAPPPVSNSPPPVSNVPPPVGNVPPPAAAAPPTAMTAAEIAMMEDMMRMQAAAVQPAPPPAAPAVPPPVPGAIPGQPLPGQPLVPGMIPGQPLPPGMIPGQVLPPGAIPGQPLPVGVIPGQPLPAGMIPGQPLPPGMIPGQPLPPGAVPGQPVPGLPLQQGLPFAGAAVPPPIAPVPVPPPAPAPQGPQLPPPTPKPPPGGKT